MINNNRVKSISSAILTLVILLIMSKANVLAQNQSLEETLQQLSQDAAAQYVSPISSALGSNVNGAWFHKAPKTKKFGFDIEVGFVGMGSFFPKTSTHFETSGQFIFSTSEAQKLVEGIGNAQIQNELITQLTSTPSSVSISGATVIGSPDDFITIAFPGGTYQTSAGAVDLPSNEVQLPIAGLGGLAEMNVLPLIAPQLTIGTLFGTQAIIRYLPETTINEEMGKLSYSGFGLQHNPFVWFGENPLPFDLSLGFFKQNAKVGDLFELNATAYGINASKQLGLRFLNITPYAGYLIEKADMQVKYQYVVDTPTGPLTQDIKFNLESENKSRFLVGLGIRFLIINLNVDYNFGKYKSITAGLNLAI